MKIIHSYWTRPLHLDLYGVDRLAHMAADARMFALSLSYARRSGFTVELHTDTLGQAVLGHLPYDDIRLTLDEIPDTIHPRFWAAGKFWAMLEAGIDAMHIDGDVFIKSPEVVAHAHRAQLFVQKVEPDSGWTWRDSSAPPGWRHFCISRGLTPDMDGSLNTGVMKFGDEDFFLRYFAAYRSFVETASASFGPYLDKARSFTPDLFAEQLMLRHISMQERIVPQTVFHETSAKAPSGFQHLITSAKYDRKVQRKLMATLQEFFPHVHNLTLKKWQHL